MRECWYLLTIIEESIMIKEEAKFCNNDIFEGMPSISAVIKSIELGVSSRRILTIYIDSQKKHSKGKEIAFLHAKSSTLGFDIEFTDNSKIEEITIGNTHGGIVAICTSREFPRLYTDCIVENGFYYLLECIEDPYNFGNAVRSIYASGANGIILGERNWLGVAGTVSRASAGASELLPVFISSAENSIDIFRKKGYTVICAGIRNSVSLFDTDLSKPLLIILGGEKRGISRSILELADKIVRIDYGNKEFKGSLSSSASAAVFSFEIMRYNKK